MKKTLLKIITPTKIFWNKKIDIVTVKTTEGYIGLQHGKSPFVASLDIAELIINKKDSKEHVVCAIAGGLLNVTTNQVEIITDTIEDKKHIDKKRAEKSKKEAKRILKSQKDAAEIHEAELSLKKALNRISVKGK